MELDRFITQVRDGNFSNIIVTGPQRSGTRIGAKIIADELNYTYTDEVDLYTDSLYRLQWFLDEQNHRVFQCPALCHNIHFFGDRDEVAIVMVHRDLRGIAASEQRIGWNTSRWARIERWHYISHTPPDTITVIAPIARKKYMYWNRYQSHVIKHPFDLRYHWLEQHPMWVPPEKRGEDWNFTQTELANED